MTIEAIHKEARHRIMDAIYTTMGEDWKLEDIIKIKKVVKDETEKAIWQGFLAGLKEGKRK